MKEKPPRAAKDFVYHRLNVLDGLPNPDWEELGNIRRYMQGFNFPGNSSYHERANNLERKWNGEPEKEKERIVPPVFRGDKSYLGAYRTGEGKKFVLIEYNRDRLSISRNYSELTARGMMVSWGFKPDGKLSLLSCFDKSRGDSVNIVGPIENNRGPYSWDKRLDLLFDYDLEGNLFSVGLRGRMDLLSKWGYNLTRDLLLSAPTNKLISPKYTRKGETELPKIASDPWAMSILQNISRSKPRFRFKDGIVTAEYS